LSKITAERTTVARRVIPPRTVITFTMVVVIAIASAAWWAWRFVSLELTAVYADGFRKAGMPEG
jgi:hypothetical protein